MVDLKQKIAGEITLSPNPGASLKKWREIFGITQTELAEFLKVTPSTISDYEGNRRKSPGISIIKRFVNAICDLDKKKGGWVVKKLQTEVKKDIYEVFEFSAPLAATDFVKSIDGKVVSNEKSLKGVKLYGCTIVDSLRAILELPVDEFTKFFGTTTERAAIFTNVSLGRSPMIAIRVMKLKPKIVVLHNITDVDKLALKIADIEKIPIVTSILPVEEIKKRAREL